MDAKKCDKNRSNIKNELFQRVKTTFSIYNDLEMNRKQTNSDNARCFPTNVQNVLEGISREALMLQAADRNIANDRRKASSKIKPNKSFIPLTDFNDVFHNPKTTKSNTQTGVSDTQLMAFADGADAIMQMEANKGITQLFDISFEKKMAKDSKLETEKIHQSAALPKSSHNSRYNPNSEIFNNIAKNNLKDSNTTCDENDKIPSLIFIQKNADVIIFNQDNNQDNKYKKSTINVDNSNTILINFSNDSLTFGSLSNEKKDNFIVSLNDKNQQDNFKISMSGENLGDNITSSPILNHKSNDIIQFHEYRSNNTKNLSSRNDSNTPGNITSSPILIRKTFDNPIIYEHYHGNQKDHTTNNMSANKLDDLNTMFDNNKKYDIKSPTFNKKSSDNIIIYEEDKINTTINSILKRKSDNNILPYKTKCKIKSSRKGLTDLNVLPSKDEIAWNTLPKHRKAASHGLPNKTVEKSRSPSPVLNTQKSTGTNRKITNNKSKDNRMPLKTRSFSLHEFEKFERISCDDLRGIKTPMSDCKVMLNSQILNKEISIPRITDEDYEDDVSGISDVKRRKIHISCQETLTNKNYDSNHVLRGFSTASKNKIYILEDEMAKSKILLDEVCLEEDVFEITNSPDQSNSKYDITTNTFQGFSTANNNKFSISEDAIVKSKKLLDEACLDEDIFGVRHSPGVSKTKSAITTNIFQGFSPENNKKKLISEDAITKSKKDLDEASLEEDIFEIRNSPGVSKAKSAITTNTFQGFSTANNKKISISEDAIAKSKKLLDEACLEEDVFEVRNSPGISKSKPAITTSTFEGFSTANNKKCSISEDAIAKSEKLLDEACLEEDVFEVRNSPGISKSKPAITTSTFEGFSTANDKKCSISEDAIAKSKKLLDEASLEEDIFEVRNSPGVFKAKSAITTNTFEAFSTASNKKISISDDAIAKSKKLLDEACLEEDIFEVRTSLGVSEAKSAITTNTFEGFSTANNKKISISEDAIAKSKKLLDEACLKEDIFKVRNSPQVSKSKPAITTSTFEGFSTANNKKCSISEDAIAKSKKLLDEACLEEDIFDIINSPGVSKSKSAITTNTFEGFSTANNEKISISEDAIAKSKKLLDEACLEEDIFGVRNSPGVSKSKPGITTYTFEGFSTENNKKILISEDAIAKSTKDLDEASLEEDIFEVRNSPGVSKAKSAITTNTFQGFSTANNKKISISEDAIAKSKKLLDEACLDEDIFGVRNSPGVSKTKFAITTNTFQGFSTANNKKISISEDAIAKSKKLLDEACLEEDIFRVRNSPGVSKSKPGITSYTSEGFSTENNKKILISEDAIAKSKKDLDEACLEEDIFEVRNSPGVSKAKSAFTTNTFQGFSTANNKKISISEDAIAKSKKLLIEACLEEDIFEVRTSLGVSEAKSAITTNTFEGFSTANNKKISISEDGIAKSKKLLDEACLEEDIFGVRNSPGVAKSKPGITSYTSEGFSTENNKKILISEDAIAKSKKDLDEASLEEDIFEVRNSPGVSKAKSAFTTNTFQGFSTANIKKISISEDAIAKSKKLLDEACLEEDIFEVRNSPGITKSKPAITTSTFEGFSTANNKKCSISEDAIAKCKKLLDEASLEEDIFEIRNSPGVSKSKPAITTNTFEGFSTANNQKISISEDTLTKSKFLLDVTCLEKEPLITNVKSETTPNTFIGFATASQKQVPILPMAIAESKNLLKSLNEINVSISMSNANSEKHNKIQINEFIDTQVIDNFNQSIFTQEIESYKKNKEIVNVRKKAGSPILFCPKAKKIKMTKNTFKVPYSQSIKRIKPEKPTTQTNQDISLTIPEIIFTNLYNIKSNRSKNRILLKELRRFNNELLIFDDTLNDFNYIKSNDALLHFKFDNKWNELSELNRVRTFQDLKCVFEKAVNASLIPNGWIENHFKLIIWKLLSYEKLFGDIYDKILTVQNILDQLKYRFDRELYQVQRPALRKIFECDEPPGRTMILCVARIYNVDDSNSSVKRYDLELTDGWYFIRSILDSMLNSAVENGKIKVGGKLLIYGAELQNCEQGKSPLEDVSAVRLKIFGNSTRRVSWDMKLGFFRSPGPFRINLETVKPTGGKNPKMRVFVARIYPPVYIEKLEDGSTVTRSERLETIYTAKFESERLNRLEKIYAQIEKEFSDGGLECQDSPDIDDTDDESCSEKGEDNVKSGSQLFRCLKKSRDPVDFQVHLTSTQTDRLRDFNSKETEKTMSKIQEKVQQKIIDSGMDKLDRNVVQLLKIRVVDWSQHVKRYGNNSSGDSKKPSPGRKSDMITGVISIWKPSEGLSEILKEGIWLDVINSTPTAIRMSEVHISAGRQTIFKKCKNNDVDENVQQMALRNVKSLEYLVKNIRSDTLFDEIDTVGLILKIEPDKFDSSSNFQNVYLTDRSKNVICLNFWGGIEKIGFASLIKIGAFISCSNLQKRMGNSNRKIPHFRVTELSCLSLFPRNKILSDALNKIKNDFIGIEINKFCQDLHSPCPYSNNLLDLDVSKNVISPFRLQNKTEYDLDKNRQFIETPQIREAKKLRDEKYICDMNLDGIDLESTFSDNSCSSGVKLTNVKMTSVNMKSVEMTPVEVESISITAVKTVDVSEDLSPALQEQKKRTKCKMERLKMYGAAPKLSPIMILNRSQVTKSYVSPVYVKHDSLTASNNVASVNNTVQNYSRLCAGTSKESTGILDSPKSNFGVKKLLNPVKLKFQSLNFDECDML